MNLKFQDVISSISWKMLFWPLFLGILLALIEGAFGSQKAVVSTENAVVFADIDLSAPIGTIHQGKEIKVGAISRKNGTVLPIIVTGKIAYIQVKDVYLKEFKVSDTKKISEHKYYDVDEKKVSDNLKENNHISLAIHQINSGADWQKFSNDQGKSGKDLTAYLLMFEHRSPSMKYHWGGGLGFYNISEENFYFKTLTVEFVTHFIPISTSIFTLDFGGGLLFSGDARIKISGTEVETRGPLYGNQFSAQAKIFPHSKFSFLGGVEIRKMYLDGFKKIPTTDPNKTAEIKTIGGIGYYLGIAYRF